ncbi:Protein FAR-RED ELONGATED HYPOCOTYL 3 [Bienertia sinuspersici]
MDKGVVKVEVNAMVVELEDSSRDADVVGDVGCTPTKECSDVVALAPPTVGMVFSSWHEVETYNKAYARQQGFVVLRAAWSGYKAKDKTRQRRNAQWTCDRFGKPGRREDSQIEEDYVVKTSKKCECLAQIYASVNAENENEWVVRKVVDEHQNHNPTHSKSRFIVDHRKEEMNYHVKRKLKLGHSAGLKVAQIHNMFARERNGLQEMAINERDIRNELYREKKLKLKDMDAKAMLEWMASINKHVLGDNVWLHGMKTTQRVKSIYSFFDDYVNNHTTMAELVEMYCRAMEKRAEKERQYDAHSETFIRQVACRFPCESVFQRCYTDMKFKEIQRECIRIMFLHYFQKVVTSDNVTEYTFENRVWCRNKEMKKEYLTQHKRNYRVHYNMKSKVVEFRVHLV